MALPLKRAATRAELRGLTLIFRDAPVFAARVAAPLTARPLPDSDLDATALVRIAFAAFAFDAGALAKEAFVAETLVALAVVALAFVAFDLPDVALPDCVFTGAALADGRFWVTAAAVVPHSDSAIQTVPRKEAICFKIFPS